MRQRLWLIAVILFSIGLDYEFHGLYSIDLPAEKGFLFLFYLSALSLYVCPILGLTLYFCKKNGVAISLTTLGLFNGLFIAGWLAAYGNQLADFLFQFILPSSLGWFEALSTSLIEETIKLLVVALTICLLNKRTLSEVLIAGISVGLGFQVIEDIGYIADAAVSDFSSLFNQTFLRISGAASSHWMFTALVAVGFFSFFLQQNLFSNDQKILYLSAPFMLHFLWNSPMNDWTIDGLSPISILVSIITIYLFIQIFMEIQQKDRNLAC